MPQRFAASATEIYAIKQRPQNCFWRYYTVLPANYQRTVVILNKNIADIVEYISGVNNLLRKFAGTIPPGRTQ
jgi:hypothetical protein